MAELHSTVRFPGVFPVEQGNFTFSVGITPSIATVTATFVGDPINVAHGTMILIYGATAIPFLNCRLDNPSFQAGDSGQAFTVRISDRRWKWEFGEISGQYNVRAADGETVLEKTEKTSRELARMLFLAMNESGFDLLDLPSFIPPESNWINANPATELANICELGGCRVVLGLDNRVRLFKTGRGKQLPTAAREVVSFGADLPDLGDSIKAYAQNTRWELLLELEAVGLEPDYSIEKLVDLSYNPAKKRAAALTPPGDVTQAEIDVGWHDQYPEALQALFADEDERQNGLKSLYRWYRVLRVAHFNDSDPDSTGFGTVPEFGTIDDIEQILPLLDMRVATYFDKSADVRKTKPAEVEGVFYDTTNDPPTFITTEPRTRYHGSFSFDSERGILQFSDPVYKMGTNDDGAPIFLPADLFLRVAVEIKTVDERIFHRAEHEISTVIGSPQNTGPLVITDKAARQTWILLYKTDIQDQSLYRLEDEHTENRDQVDSDLEETLIRRLSELDVEESQTSTYTGLIKHELDGATPQISWKIGPGGSSTTISRNTEHDLNIPRFLARRREEKRRDRDNDNEP